jgi:DNA-binding MarR family transcriptional regulator
MKNTNNTNKRDFAQDIANLTMDMEKVCRTKETYFCDKINITPVEFKCLRYLLENSFPQVKELASHMNLTAARVTNLLNSLEKKQYITRSISHEDRRVIQVELTVQGKEFANTVQDEYIKFHQEIIKTIGDENELINLLESIKAFKVTLENFLKNKENEKIANN